MSTAKVQLELVDVLGAPLDEHRMLIEFFSNESSKQFQAHVALNGARTVTVNLEDPGNGIYRIRLTPTNYRVIQFFLRVAEDSTVTRDPVIFPVDADKVMDITAPAFTALPGELQSFLNRAEGSLHGSALYTGLAPILKAALLNLYAKSAATELGDSTSVFSKLGAMIELDQDRLFAKTGAALLEETQQDTFFHQVGFDLHKSKPPYAIFDSYKTRDAHGNLQLTFSRKGVTGNDYLADMDIDEGQGISHLFEVLQNAITGGLTNPYNVREILVADQELTPLYGFRFAATGTITASVAAG